MNASTSLDEVLTAVSRILLWCFVIGILLLLFWFGCLLAVGDLPYRIHASLFDLSQHEFDMMIYYAIAWMKACIFLFFFIPWLATRLTLSGMRKAAA